jgi:hypothetical protein
MLGLPFARPWGFPTLDTVSQIVVGSPRRGAGPPKKLLFIFNGGYIMVKQFFRYMMCLCLVIPVLNIYGQDEIIPDLTGSYLGQKPPGQIPKVFAKGIVSTEAREYSITFSPDLDEIYWARKVPLGEKEDFTVFVSKKIADWWSKPRVADFCGDYYNHEPFITLNNKVLFWRTKRPLASGEIKAKLWMLEREKEKGPHNPKPATFGAMYMGGTPDGTIYYYTKTDAGYGLARSKYKNSEYQKPELVSDVFRHSGYYDGHPTISPDGDVIIIDSEDRPGSDKCGLYISFNKENGKWTPLKNMYEAIKGKAWAPMFSPDGKYLFFYMNKDIYWVDAQVIEKLK